MLGRQGDVLGGRHSISRCNDDSQGDRVGTLSCKNASSNDGYTDGHVAFNRGRQGWEMTECQGPWTLGISGETRNEDVLIVDLLSADPTIDSIFYLLPRFSSLGGKGNISGNWRVQ